jgi:hypothetical protein
MHVYKFENSGLTTISTATGVSEWLNYDIVKTDVSTMSSGLTVYRNNVLLHTFDTGDSTYTSGHAGVNVFALNTEHKIWFDNFTIEYESAISPIISDISNKAANATVGYIDFITDVNCDSTITYSVNSNMSSAKWVNTSADWPSNNTQSHTVKIIGLSGNTQYYYQIYAYNSSDNSNFSNSTIQTYTTATGQTFINVSTSESIQNAVDNIYPYGIVNLSVGTFELTEPIWITANNVTLQGQGNTVVNQTIAKTTAIIGSKYLDFNSRWTWLITNNKKQDALITHMANNPDEVINNLTIQNMTVKGFYSSGTDYVRIIGMVEGKELNVLNLNITGNLNDVATDRLSGTFMTHFVNGSVQNTVYSQVSEPLIYFYSDNADFINNKITEGNAANSIQYNSIRGTYRNCIISNNNLTGLMGKINVYSSQNVEIFNNAVVITAAINTGAIHYHIPVGNGYIYNNTVVFNCGTSGGTNGAGIYVSTNYNFQIFGNISNNVIYNSKGNGITIIDQSSRPSWIFMNITGNTINNATKHGIFNPLKQPVSVWNNIITNNGYSGLYNISNNTYNNIWNNALGNYNLTSNGTGDISVNPHFYSNNDFHLNSTTGTWNGISWEVMLQDSLCIDAGNPTNNYANEPSPNGDRINMGAYGNTIYASKTLTTEIETFIVAAGVFAAVVFASSAVVSRRVRRGISGFWNRRIRRR